MNKNISHMKNAPKERGYVSRLASGLIALTTIMSTIALPILPVALNTAQAVATTTVFLTTTGAHTWTVPADFSSINTVEVIGGGGNGSSDSHGGGGGGGGYSSISNLALTPGNSINYTVGSVASDTWFNATSCSSSSVCAKKGASASEDSGGAGGSTSGAIGTTKRAGGSGADGNHSNKGGGGGGAAGKNANGNSGSTTGPGGQGDGTFGGAGGSGGSTNGNPGGNGTEYDSTHGSGGGGQGSAGGNNQSGGAGGLYGAGGGGARGSGTGGAGKQGLIVITYTPALANGSLTIVKTVLNNNGGTKQVSDFVLKIDGSAVTSGQANTLATGPHTASEINLPGYTASAWGGDCNADGTITLASGDHKTCTITNDDIGGKLVIRKQTVGGFDSFGFHVSHENESNPGLQPFSLTTDSDHNPAAQSFFDIFVDVYSLTESPPSGWDQTSATCDNENSVNAVHIGLGQTVTCTFVNTKRGHIIVHKVTHPENQTSFAFSASYGGGFSLANGESNDSGPLVPGTYSVSETPNNDYVTTSVCSDESNPSSIKLNPGETVTCTFTNTIKQAGLTIVKETNPSHTDQSFEFQPSWGNDFNLASGGLEHFSLDPGTYSVGEVNAPEGWDLTSAICSNDSQPSNINLGPDEAVVCTFTNTERGHLIVQKVTDPHDTQTEFSITAEGDGNVFGDATRHLVGGGSVNYEVTPGNYSVNEKALPQGWTLSNNGCEDVSVGAGATTECTLTNVTLPTLTIVKKTVGGDGSFDFSVTNHNTQTITTAEGSGSKDISLTAGTYTVAETVPQGWSLTKVSCEYDNESVGDLVENGERVSLNNGDHVVCNFMNTKENLPPNSSGGGSDGGVTITNFAYTTPVPAPSGGGEVAGTSTEAAATTTPVNSSEASCKDNGEYIHDYLRMGKKNNPEEVKKLQKFLNEKLGLNLPITGHFGLATYNAVKELQLKYWQEILAPWVKYGLPHEKYPTGYVYKTTKRWINMLVCSALNLPKPILP